MVNSILPFGDLLSHYMEFSLFQRISVTILHIFSEDFSLVLLWIASEGVFHKGWRESLTNKDDCRRNHVVVSIVTKKNTTTQSLASATRFQCFPLTQSLRLSLMAFHAKILCRAPDKPFPTVTSPYSMEIFFIFQNCQILRNFTESHSASFQGWFPATKTVSSPTLAQ